MPTLDFKGKQFVYSHHLSVPFRELKVVADKSLPLEGKSPSLDDNLIIHGDNLEALKALLPTHAGKVDCIFIDPPYNTGNEGWCYNDNVRSPLMQEWLKVSANPVDKDDLERHDKWLCMMLPRLTLLRELLSETGTIFVCINDVEQHSLRLILDDVFGDQNFLSTLVWEKGKKGDSTFFSNTHEYIHVYSKNKENLKSIGTKWRSPKEGIDEVLGVYQKLRKKFGSNHDDIREAMQEWYRGLPNDAPEKKMKHYCHSDDRGLYFPDNFAGPDDGRKNRPRYDIFHPLTGEPCAKPSTGWRWDESTTKRALEATPPLIHFGKDHSTIPNRKTYLKKTGGEAFNTVFYKDGRSATLQVEQLVGEGVFSYPKDVDVVAALIDLCCHESATVLDSFAGSGTTLHAVLKLNNTDAGRRRFIGVQLPEVIQKDTKAALAGYDDVIDITRTRISKVIQGYETEKKTKEELLTKNITWSDFKQSEKTMKLLDSIESETKGQYHSYQRVIKNGVLRLYGVRNANEKVTGLDGSFTFCELGEPIRIENLLSGEGMPSFDALARYVFYTATGQSLESVAKASADGFIGETDLFRIHLFYRPDSEWLRSNEAALNAEKVDTIVANNSTKKRTIVFAVAKFMSQKDLTEKRIEFCQLPYAIHRIMGA
ncbi:site-specific DNA-methyltransferase [Vibrio parahaemolyticus]|nr:site-specific DNA-methyltransferase [Vibrio parahaemolyticus]EKB3555388.1 site-specific DNA-methyltransferase [Vibrio parahaemolyticus]